MTTSVMIFVPKQNHQRVQVITENLYAGHDGETRWMADQFPKTLDHGDHIITYVHGAQRLILEEVPFPKLRQRVDDTILGLAP